jgi:hypothetical protein
MLFLIAAVQHKEAVMKTETKRESVTDTRPSSFVSLLSGWVQQAMESFFATQRILVEVAMRQNASTMKAMRESLSDPEHSPATMLSELAMEGTSNFIEAQRILLDLANKENELLMSGIKDRVNGSKTAVAMTNVMRRSVDNFVGMQQEFLTIASKQTEKMINETKAGKPYNGTHLIDVAREGMDNFVRTQKKLLDVISEETSAVTNKGGHPAKPAAKTEIRALAKESVNALVDAQKKLLDVAAQQVKTNLKVATRASETTIPLRLPIAKLTGEGVKSFVDAEKALIDTMTKATHHPTKVVEVRTRKAARRKSTRRSGKTMAARA